MPTGVFSKILGTVSSFFHIGGPAGPTLNNNAGTLEVKNGANSALANLNVATPTADTHAVTKAYVDTIFRPTPVSQQFNGGSALPSNSGTEQWYIVTTSGAQATIGQILWDDGSSAGTVTVLAAATGNEVVTTAAFTGGTLILSANQNYVWTGSTWLNISPTVAGVDTIIRIATGTAATYTSTTSIPAGAYVSHILFDVTTPYTGGTTISVGQTGSASLLMATGDNVATVANQYVVEQDTTWGASPLPLLVTVSGSPSAGVGAVLVKYALPNS